MPACAVKKVDVWSSWAPGWCRQVIRAWRVSHGMQHGAESFFIEGEGLVDASLGGRSGAEPDRVDAANAAGPSLPVGDPPPFRFSRIGPKGRQLNDRNRLRIAAAM